MDERDFWDDLAQVMAKVPVTLLYSKNGVTEILFFTQFMEGPPSYRERKEIVKEAFRAERQRRQGQCTPTKV